MIDLSKNNELLESNSSFINAVDKMVYWSKLFGVLSWICAIFLIIFMIFVLAEDMPLGGEVVGILICLGFYIYSGNLLLRFSKQTRAGLNDQNKDAIAVGFISMGNLFSFMGTLTVIALCLYTLMIFGVLFG